MKKINLPIAIIILAIIVALGILFVNNNDRQEADSAPKADILAPVNDQPSEKPAPIETNIEKTEYDKRQEIRNQYQSYGKESGYELVFKKPIDKTFLLANQYEGGGNKYYADTFAALNTEKLQQISASEFQSARQNGIDILTKLNMNPMSVTNDAGCINIKLDNGGYKSFCNSTPDSVTEGVLYSYKGYYQDLDLHLVSSAYEESSSGFYSQKDGQLIGVQFHKQLLSSDKTILVSYNPEFAGAYTQGGLSVIGLSDWKSKGMLQMYGGYAGFERFGVEEVKIDQSNVIYFKTVAYANTRDAAGKLEKTYSYFKQEIK